MPLLAHLTSNFKNNLAAIKMEDLFYHPAATQLTLFIIKNIFFHLENNATGLIDPKNAIPLESPIPVFVNNRC